MKFDRDLLENFIKESILDQRSKEKILIKEFLKSSLDIAQTKLDMESGDKDKSTESPKMTKPIGTEADANAKKEPNEQPADSEDTEKKDRDAIANNSEKIAKLRTADKYYKNASANLTNTLNNLSTLPISSNTKSAIKSAGVQTVNQFKKDIGKQFNKLSDRFEKAGEDKDLLTKVTMMGSLSKILLDLEKGTQ